MVGALHIQGGRLQYVEVDSTTDGPSVVTVGHHVLEEDLSQAILAEGGMPREVRDRLREVRDALSAERGRVVVPPSAVYSFFVPLPAEAGARERRQHVLQQTALVTGMGTVAPLHVESSGVRPAPDQEGRPYEWVHVLALSDEVRTQFREAFDLGEEDEWPWMVSSEAAAHVPRVETPNASAPFTLLAGEYDPHTEFSLVHEGDWHHAQYTEAPEHPDDLGYSVRSFLNSVDVSPAAVGQLATYGDPMLPAHRSVLEEEMGREAATLNPFATLAGEKGEGEPSTFVPCVGGALHALDD
jgi:hypothetical protein